VARSGWDVGNYLRNASSSPITARPWTFAGWMFRTGGWTASTTMGVCTITDKDVANERNGFYVGVTSGSNAQLQAIFDETVVQIGTGTLNGLENQWVFVAWVERAANDRSAWVNTSETTDSTNLGFGSGADSVTFGVFGDSTPSSPATNIALAEFGFWNRALDTAELAELAARYTPDHFPRGQVGYWPLNDGAGAERDFGSGGRTLSETGTVTYVEHPRMIPRRRRVSAFVPATVTTFTAAAALATAPATLGASATFSAGTKTATAALSAGAATLSGSATFSPGTKTAAAAISAGAATLSGSATHTPPTYTGSAALSAAPATLAAAATRTPPTYTASAAVTTAPATLAGSAAYSSSVSLGTAAVTTGAATLAGSATFAAGTKTATGAMLAGAATLAASAEFDAPVYTATAALQSGATTLAGGAQHTMPTYTAAATIQAGAATLSASGTFSAGTKTAAANLTTAPAVINGAATYTPPSRTAAAVLTTGAAVLAGVAATQSVADTVGGRFRRYGDTSREFSRVYDAARRFPRAGDMGRVFRGPNSTAG
jgi:hypothetical protein